MDDAQRANYFELGRNFYEWYASGNLKFIFGTEGKELEPEIKRLSELIEYVKSKRQEIS